MNDHAVKSLDKFSRRRCNMLPGLPWTPLLGALFLGRETITPILPRTLQMLSITFYLKQIYPVHVSTGSSVLSLFTVVPEPLSSYTATLGLLCFTAAVLVFSCYRIRRVEITYTTD